MDGGIDSKRTSARWIHSPIPVKRSSLESVLAVLMTESDATSGTQVVHLWSTAAVIAWPKPIPHHIFDLYMAARQLVRQKPPQPSQVLNVA